MLIDFRQRPIWCRRIGCLRLDRPKQPLNRPKAVVTQGFGTLCYLGHCFCCTDGTDVGKSKANLHHGLLSQIRLPVPCGPVNEFHKKGFREKTSRLGEPLTPLTPEEV